MNSLEDVLLHPILRHVNREDRPNGIKQTTFALDIRNDGLVSGLR